MSNGPNVFFSTQCLFPLCASPVFTINHVMSFCPYEALAFQNSSPLIVNVYTHTGLNCPTVSCLQYCPSVRFFSHLAQFIKVTSTEVYANIVVLFFFVCFVCTEEWNKERQ